MMSESILATMTTAFSGEDSAFEGKLLYRFFGLLAQTAAPVSLETLAQALACERSQVAQVLNAQYPEAEYDESGNLIGVGLTLRPTTHQLVVENRAFYTWCAPDALHIAVVLGRPAQIVSRCPVTGTRIEVTLTPARMTAFTPAGAVVSFPKHASTLRHLKEAASGKAVARMRFSSHLGRSPHRGSPNTQTSVSFRLKKPLRTYGNSPTNK